MKNITLFQISPNVSFNLETQSTRGNSNMQNKLMKTLVINLFRQLSTLMLLVGILGFTPVANVYAAGSTIYVKADAGGANNGSSWTDAYTDLQDALSVTVSGDQIWVAAGTYYPTTDTNRSATFALVNGVGIYGGFAGVETLLTERDTVVNVTVGKSMYKFVELPKLHPLNLIYQRYK